MASGSNDPKLLYAISGVSAYHLTNGNERLLTPAGPQTLSLLMVPTSSPFADAALLDPKASPAEEDFYLHLHLPPELDLPLPATTQIYHQPPRSYLIPRWDLGPESATFTKIEFPALDSRKGVQDDVDTFETILAQCTAFLERAPPPVPRSTKRESPPAGSSSTSASKAATAAATSSVMDEKLPAYNPGDYKPGEGYAKGSRSSKSGGQIVLIDEEDGSVIGELGDDYQIVQDSELEPGSKDPVQITLPADGMQKITIAPASDEDVEMALHPSYKKSFLVSNAVAASRLIVTTSDMVAKKMQSSADSYTLKSEPTSKPVTFKPTTKEHIRRIHTFTSGAADLSAKTAGSIGKVAQNLGATLGRHKGNGQSRGYDKDGNVRDNFKPGLLNKSLMAFSTIADGVEKAGRNLLENSSTATTKVVEHKWGPDAGDVSRSLGGGVKNVGLVYIDVTGVSRRAIIKSVAKGMVVGRVANGGGQVIVGDAEGVEGSSAGGASPSGQEQRLVDQGPTNSGPASIAGSEKPKKGPVKYA
ncbi:senescence-associated protein-domain-containing protein [Coniella lustricola]|uniref:Senescence-associated protein-domain-containing protein n=1 Tax=Coniella lustricola TaxID=2025994 RepID=A0A2T3ANX1_9PEZI|nr:senescence-associated protein-domain-containing protein [Coniella lustricola]